jgi:NADPH:quinone reductase-like Zn-dependent oxidoreductase
MKAIVLDGDVGIDHLREVERAQPVPRRGEVVLRIRAASLNYRDLDIVRGTYPMRLPLPLVPISDGVGEVIATGDEVTRVKVGDRVAGTFWQRWLAGPIAMCDPNTQLGGHIDGMLSEFVRLDSEGVVRVPEHLTDIEAATLPCAALTAWNALVTEGNVKAGDTVLVQGTGGASIFALQFALLSGAQVIVTSSSDKKLERARDLGASACINYIRTPKWHEEVLSLTNGRGVDHVIEVGGPTTMIQSLLAVRRGGQINVIGYVGGTDGGINPLLILQQSARVRGIAVGSRQSFEAMNDAVAVHKMKPVIDRAFTWTDVAKGLLHLESGQHFGKIVLTY